MVELPAWVKKYKTKGVEIHRRKSAFYACKVTSKWDPSKGRARKITLAYLGKITPEGIVPPKHERVLQTRITSVEAGASRLLLHLTTALQEHLRAVYPETWQALIAVAIQRLLYTAPLKSMQLHYQNSALATDFVHVSLEARAVSDLLRTTGADRDSIVAFLQRLQRPEHHVIVDLTAIFSSAEHLSYLAPGHNSEHRHEPHANLLLLFAAGAQAPTYYRLLPGSVPDVKSIQLTLEESGAQQVVFVGDKGFFSAKNAALFDAQRIEYILPLHRNYQAIKYAPMRRADKRGFDGYFLFDDRPIWYYERPHGKGRIILYLDERLRTDEQRTHLGKLPTGKELEAFHAHAHEYGTIAVLTSTADKAQVCYENLKCRLQIETAFDALKNILDADRTYMHTDHHLEGWFFVNFLALTMYYTLFNHLQQHKLLANYSPKDLIYHCSKVHQLTINERTIITEVPKNTRELLRKLDIPEKIFEPITKKLQS